MLLLLMGENMMKFLTIFLGCIFLSGCVAPADTKEVQGILTIGHEVRSFRDYKTNKEYWIIDRSGTLLPKYYQEVGPNAVIYQPIFAVLKVTETAKPQDGFGSEYDGCYELQEIILLSNSK